MEKIENLLTIAEAYSEARQISEARTSTLCLNDGGRLGAIRLGADMGARRLDRAMQWLSDNWPEDVQWPVDIDRPAQTTSAELEAAQ